MTLVACGAIALIAGIAIASKVGPNHAAAPALTTTTQVCNSELPYLPSCTAEQRVVAFQRLLEGGGATKREAACLAPSVERGFRTDPGGHPSAAVETAFRRCLGPATRFDYSHLITYVSKQLFGS